MCLALGLRTLFYTRRPESNPDNLKQPQTPCLRRVLDNLKQPQTTSDLIRFLEFSSLGLAKYLHSVQTWIFSTYRPKYFHYILSHNLTNRKIIAILLVVIKIQWSIPMVIFLSCELLMLSDKPIGCIKIFYLH